MVKRNRLSIILSILLALFIGSYFIYNMLFPGGPVLDTIPNPISDKAKKNWAEQEASIETNPNRNLYFGDLHVHTCYSFDAYIGGANATPNEAYQFAKGQEIEVFEQKVKIRRPLDFAAVTDHSEFLGELYSIQTDGAPAYHSLTARFIRSIGLDTARQRAFFRRAGRRVGSEKRSHMDIFQGYETTKSAWQMILEAAEHHYEPGKFTTLAAYEWTLSGITPEGGLGAHMHRNVFFRDMKVPDYPMSAVELTNAEQLWEYLDQITAEGATVMAVPHNTNLSAGRTFPETDQNGDPIGKAYAESSNRHEPLFEIHQAKGNSEVHAALWPNDEFADFENYALPPPKVNNYGRYVLKKGLEYEAELGINPYKFGFIASTDTHNGTPGNTEEDDEFIANHALLDLSGETRAVSDWLLSPEKKTYELINPGGLVAVWAEANTRGHIYDAMRRKETYGTSGGRIQVRFFGGYAFEADYPEYDDLVTAGYTNGVPMGSDLPARPEANSRPSFLIWAAKDPESANLDRIQVVKGWYKDGKLEEKIFHVALSDGRTLNADGSVPDNGATVDLKTGAYSEDKGAVHLQTVWTDPEFDPSVPAFYYLRVLEIPTAHWRLWDKIRYGTEFERPVSLTVRERAWSSPIWYNVD